LNEGTNTHQGGLPTGITLDHAGYTVPNLDEAIAFFTDVLGFELISRHGPMESSDDKMKRIFGVHPRASVHYAFLRYGNDKKVEIAEWHAPDQNTFSPKNSDLAGHHLAFTVADLDAAIAYPKGQPGVQILEPNGRGFVYFSTPWGMLMQIIASR
jgi:catechol 2,3-dioxygenase-like lactoylglutathione lyase family enzyme